MGAKEEAIKYVALEGQLQTARRQKHKLERQIESLTGRMREIREQILSLAGDQDVTRAFVDSGTVYVVIVDQEQKRVRIEAMTAE